VYYARTGASSVSAVVASDAFLSSAVEDDWNRLAVMTMMTMMCVVDVFAWEIARHDETTRTFPLPFVAIVR
jgi:hypothetical protein